MKLNIDFARKTLIPLAFSIWFVGCSDSTSSVAGDDFNGGGDSVVSEPTGFDEATMIDGLITQVIIPANESFEQSSSDLVSAITGYCEALTANTAVSSASTAAQQAWRDTMSHWQQIEVMQLEPLLNNDSSLRNSIYSWPTTSECAVDQDVGLFETSNGDVSSYDISRRTNSRRGLDAAEYLLFNENLNHSCPNDSLAPDGWNARPDSEKQIARCLFAIEVASDIENSATVLKNEWISDNGFAADMRAAGSENSGFESVHAAVNHITDALFYIDSITKDLKLAAPIGLAANSCGTAACTDDLESNISDNAIVNVKNNMLALQSLYLGAPVGTDGVGFDDYLMHEDIDQTELATTMANDIQAAIDAADAFEGSALDAVSNNPERIQALHSAVKNVTDNLKSMFITYLSLELPITSAGDAD